MLFFFFNDTATTEIYTLSLHDALPIFAVAAAVLAVVILLAPLLFWLAWNVLDFAHAVGLPDLGFWGIVLATLFLVVGWLGTAVITGIVFLVDPSWFADGRALVPWPDPTLRCFLAPALPSRRS